MFDFDYLGNIDIQDMELEYEIMNRCGYLTENGFIDEAEAYAEAATSY